MWLSVKATLSIPWWEVRGTVALDSFRFIGRFIDRGLRQAVSPQLSNFSIRERMPKPHLRSTAVTGIRGVRGGRVHGVLKTLKRIRGLAPSLER
jgi:hypothetical protein